MLSLAPNFAAQNPDMGMSIVNLFWYAEPFQHGLGNPRNVAAGIWENTSEGGRQAAVERLPQ